MGSNWYTVATAVLLLIGVALVYAGILFAIFWIVGKIVNFVLNIETVQRLLNAIMRWSESWWKLYKMRLQNLWEFMFEIIIEPFFFAYIIFVLFNKISSFSNYTKLHLGTNILDMFNQDMISDKSFYLFFMAIFFLWMVGKAWNHRRQSDSQNVIITSLKRLETTLGYVQQSETAAVNKEIRETLKHIREKNNKGGRK